MGVDDIGSAAMLDISNYVSAADALIDKTEQMQEKLNAISESLKDPIPITVDISQIEQATEKLDELKLTNIDVSMNAADVQEQLNNLTESSSGLDKELEIGVTADTSAASASIYDLTDSATSLAENSYELLITADDTQTIDKFVEIEDKYEEIKQKVAEPLKVGGEGGGEEEGGMLEKLKGAAEGFGVPTGLLNAGPEMLVGAGAAVALGEGLHKSVEAATSFQQSMQSVGALTGQTTSGLKEIAEEASGGTTVGLNEAGQAMISLADNGVRTKDMEKDLAASITLSEGGIISMGSATTVLSTTLKQFHQDGTQAAQDVNIMIAASQLGKTSTEDMASALRIAGPTASAAGLSFADTAGSLSLMEGAGIRARTASSDLNTILKDMSDPPKKVAEGLTSIGVSADDINPQLHSFDDVIADLKTHITSSAEASKIFGTTAGPGLWALLQQANLKEYTQDLQNSNAGVEAADKNTQTYEASMKKFGAAIETCEIDLGTLLLPILTDFVTVVDEGVTALDKLGKGLYSTGEYAANTTNSGLQSLGNVVQQGTNWLDKNALGMTDDQISAQYADPGKKIGTTVGENICNGISDSYDDINGTMNDVLTKSGTDAGTAAGAAAAKAFSDANDAYAKSYGSYISNDYIMKWRTYDQTTGAVTNPGAWVNPNEGQPTQSYDSGFSTTTHALNAKVPLSYSESYGDSSGSEYGMSEMNLTIAGKTYSSGWIKNDSFDRANELNKLISEASGDLHTDVNTLIGAEGMNLLQGKEDQTTYNARMAVNSIADVKITPATVTIDPTKLDEDKAFTDDINKMYKDNTVSIDDLTKAYKDFQNAPNLSTKVMEDYSNVQRETEDLKKWNEQLQELEAMPAKAQPSDYLNQLNTLKSEIEGAQTSIAANVKDIHSELSSVFDTSDIPIGNVKGWIDTQVASMASTISDDWKKGFTITDEDTIAAFVPMLQWMENNMPVEFARIGGTSTLAFAEACADKSSDLDAVWAKLGQSAGTALTTNLFGNVGNVQIPGQGGIETLQQQIQDWISDPSKLKGSVDNLDDFMKNYFQPKLGDDLKGLEDNMSMGYKGSIEATQTFITQLETLAYQTPDMFTTDELNALSEYKDHMIDLKTLLKDMGIDVSNLADAQKKLSDSTKNTNDQLNAQRYDLADLGTEGGMFEKGFIGPATDPNALKTWQDNMLNLAHTKWSMDQQGGLTVGSGTNVAAAPPDIDTWAKYQDYIKTGKDDTAQTQINLENTNTAVNNIKEGFKDVNDTATSLNKTVEATKLNMVDMESAMTKTLAYSPNANMLGTQTPAGSIPSFGAQPFSPMSPGLASLPNIYTSQSSNSVLEFNNALTLVNNSANELGTTTDKLLTTVNNIQNTTNAVEKETDNSLTISMQIKNLETQSSSIATNIDKTLSTSNTTIASMNTSLDTLNKDLNSTDKLIESMITDLGTVEGILTEIGSMVATIDGIFQDIFMNGQGGDTGSMSSGGGGDWLSFASGGFIPGPTPIIAGDSPGGEWLIPNDLMSSLLNSLSDISNLGSVGKASASLSLDTSSVNSEIEKLAELLKSNPVTIPAKIVFTTDSIMLKQAIEAAVYEVLKDVRVS